jgi:hypothetical protein
MNETNDVGFKWFYFFGPLTTTLAVLLSSADALYYKREVDNSVYHTVWPQINDFLLFNE